MLTAEVAIYPLKTDEASKVINSSLQTLAAGEVNFAVNGMNTHVRGGQREVFESLQKMFSEAESSGGEISMVVTITNAEG